MNFFKKNSQNSLLKSKTYKFLRHMVGEVLFVMIGILLAVQINNWNLVLKNRKAEQVLYRTLISSLENDLEDVTNKVYNIEKSIKAQEIFIINSFDEIKSEFGLNQLEDLLYRVSKSSSSFFPNDGLYYKISNNKQINLIQSQEIQIKIIELYEQYYKRYKDIDANLENIAVFNLFSNYFSRIQVDYINNNSSYKIDFQTLEKDYHVLKYECSNIHSMSIFAQSSMIKCQKEIKDLLILLRKELK
jgi:hypothetical protein